jgi:hypothetical protein
MAASPERLKLRAGESDDCRTCGVTFVLEGSAPFTMGTSMYALMFQLDLADSVPPHEHYRSGRSLATALEAMHGFVAFIALEAEDGMIGGLCIGVDAATLEQARHIVGSWQCERGRSAITRFEPLMAGEVIVQRGF